MKKAISNLGNSLKKSPVISFILLLMILLGIISYANSVRKVKVETEKVETTPKAVRLFNIGTVPKLPVQAKVEKTGAVTVVAQSGGIVQKIYKNAGEPVNRGQWLAAISTNYQGGVIETINRQLAEKDYNFKKDNLQLQKDIINKGREIANNNESNDYQLREISKKSLDETREAIAQVNANLESIDNQIKPLAQAESNGTISASEQSILNQLRSSKLNLTTTRNSLADQLRRNEYNTNNIKINENNDNPPIRNSQALRDQTLKNLDLQEKQLQLSLDVALLNLRASQIREAMMYPAAPLAGTVDRVFVKEGQYITPGTAIASIAGNTSSVQIIALVSSETAKLISRLETSTLNIDGETIELMPTHISQEPTDGALHSVIFNLPSEHAPRVPNNGLIRVELPMVLPQTQFYDPYVPIDAIYQGQDEAYLYVAVEDEKTKKLKATARKIMIGQVYGDYVMVQQGLKKQDRVILNRNIIEGDIVEEIK